MKITEKIRSRLEGLSIRQRLTYSNILMFVIPVAVTAVVAVGALGIAFYAFVRFYLPRMGLTVKELHEMGEQYEDSLKSFLVLIAALCLVMLGLLILSIVITDRFLTRFMLRRVEEPLALLGAGVAQISRGNLDHTVKYDRNDEFGTVCTAFNDMARRLAASAERSAAEDQSRRELFAGISHDLRSPLTSVRAYTEALLDGVAATPEDTRRYLTKIRLHESQIEQMVEALFLYTKMELKDYPVHLQTLDLEQELERICKKCRADGHLFTEISGIHHRRVVADPFLFERVILNLLDNSRKYRKGEAAHVHISAVMVDGGVWLSVADDGIGVPDELLSRLFEPFYRTDPARSNPAGGSGLGLSIVRAAVEHMGGKVWAEKASGGGLNVIMTLASEEEKCNGKEDIDN